MTHAPLSAEALPDLTLISHEKLRLPTGLRRVTWKVGPHWQLSLFGEAGRVSESELRLGEHIVMSSAGASPRSSDSWARDLLNIAALLDEAASEKTGGKSKANEESSATISDEESSARVTVQRTDAGIEVQAENWIIYTDTPRHSAQFTLSPAEAQVWSAALTLTGRLCLIQHRWWAYAHQLYEEVSRHGLLALSEDISAAQYSGMLIWHEQQTHTATLWHPQTGWMSGDLRVIRGQAPRYSGEVLQTCEPRPDLTALAWAHGARLRVAEHALRLVCDNPSPAHSGSVALFDQMMHLATQSGALEFA